MKHNLEFCSTLGGEIAYQKIGEGPLVFVLSGGPGLSCSYIADVLSIHSHNFTYYCIDQPGCGASDCIAAPSLKFTVKTVSEVINTLSNNEPYRILAHSWGALLQILCVPYLKNNPVNSCWLNPSPMRQHELQCLPMQLLRRLPLKEIIKILYKLPSALRNSFYQDIIHILLPAYTGNAKIPNVHLDWRFDTFKQITRDLGFIDFKALNTQILNPKVLYGERDIISPSNAQYIENGIFHLEDGGHFMLHENPLHFTSLIENLLMDI